MSVEFYTIPEVMRLLRLGRTHIYDEIRRGRLGSVVCGRARRVPAECLHAYRRLLMAESGLEVGL